MGQGVSPRRWRKRLAGNAFPWMAAAGRERIGALCAELASLPDQDRVRPDPVYQLAALRKGAPLGLGSRVLAPRDQDFHRPRSSVPRLRISVARSRISTLRILPVTVIGNSSTMCTYLGIL